MAMLTGEWLDAMQDEFQKPYYKDLTVESLYH